MRSLSHVGAMLGLCILVCSCGDADSSASYMATWGEVDAGSGSNTRIYEKTEDLGDYQAGYAIEPGGRLVVATSEYVGGDFPSRVEYAGTWELETRDVLVFHYENYRGRFTVRFEIVQIGNRELRAVVTKSAPD